MLPVVVALTAASPSGFIGLGVLHAVGVLPFGSALPDIESSGLFVYTGVPAPGSLPGTMASADSPPGRPVGVSPGKSAMLPGATAAFTSATEPDGFAVWCPLAPSRRP